MRRTNKGSPRLEWLQHEATCLLCGRLITRLVHLVGSASTGTPPEDTAKRVSQRIALMGLRCATCGGNAMIGTPELVWGPEPAG